MIVETMSNNEIVRQMEMDRLEIIQMTKVKMEFIKFRRQIAKTNAKDFPIYASPFIVKTLRRNKWIVILRARTKKEKDYLTVEHATLICLASFRDGLFAFVSSHLWKNNRISDSGVIIFQPHFFARYRERYDLTETGTDLIARYFVNNNNLYRDYQYPYNDNVPIAGRKVYGTSEQGVALGELITETAILFRTYVSYDMLFDDQITEYTRSEILRKQGMRNYQVKQSRHRNEAEGKEERWFDFILNVLAQEMENEQLEQDLENALLEFTKRFLQKYKGTFGPNILRLYVEGLTQTVFIYQQGKMPMDVLLAMKELDCNQWKPRFLLLLERLRNGLIFMYATRNNTHVQTWKTAGSPGRIYL